MTGEILVQQEIAPGPRYALDACALSFGATRGPILLVSSQPSWERILRRRLGDRFFTIDDLERPPAQAWIGAAWLEPLQSSWYEQLQAMSRELPGGSLLSIVQSLPLSAFRRTVNPHAVGIIPHRFLQFRSELIQNGFRLERSFGFQTLWWSVLGRISTRVALSRPDLGDRIQFAKRRGFATHGPALAFSMSSLIEARAGMRPE